MAAVLLAQLDPERQLLLACGRQVLDQQAGQNDLVISAHVDWSACLDLASYHGFTAILAAALKANDRTAPPEVLTRLANELRQSAARSLLLSSELIALHELFETCGIHAIPYKGPVLAALLYSGSMSRQFNDLDIFVPERDVGKVTALLEARGYRSRLALSWEHSFVRDDTGVMVDVHWAFTNRLFPFRLSMDDTWPYVQEVMVAGRALSTFSIEHTLLIQCANAAKDDWLSLGQIYEIGQLIRGKDINWTRVRLISEHLGCERVVYLGLFLAHELFGVFLPDEIAQAIRVDRIVIGLAGEVIARMGFSRQFEQSYVANEYFRMKMWTRFQDKIPFLRRIVRFLVTPNEKDLEVFRLPRSLTFVYYLIRPARLAIKHLHK